MYQPEIIEENIRRLYRLKLERNRPMTKLLNQILDDFFMSCEQKHINKGRETRWTKPNQSDSPPNPSP